MKTKTSLLTALVAFAGGASLMAQVYSVNMVGYINLTLGSGFNLVANQLVAGTNGLNQVFPAGSVLDGTLLYKFQAGTGSWNIDFYNGDPNAAAVGWYDSSTFNPSATTVSPGEAVFINSPAATNVTLVGEVKTGTNTVVLNPGFSLVSSVVPASYELTGTNFPATDGMLHYRFSGGSWVISFYNGDPNAAAVGWYDSSTFNPVTVSPAVGQGFFINNPTASNINWTRSFSVN